MKTFFSIVLVTINAAEAFVPARFGAIPSVTSSSALNAQTADEAIKAALEASKAHGPTSKEARVAWDIVEEINASDNSAAFTGGVVDAETSAEYDEKVLALSKILEEQKEQIESVKDLASKIRAIKLTKPESSPQPVSAAMEKALAEARDLTEKFGATSTEAKLAWETVEDIAQNDSSEAMKNDLTDECLIETIEACEAIEELQRALYVNEHAGSGRYQG
mmetsp:Transcript_17033/g.21546  ORF Transcript_17033/g.21546 Transcript_17033/m.21546 type:complete len:220 (+) Transcript_17033:90-749(+)